MFNGIPELPEDSWLYRAFAYARERSKLSDSTVFWTLMSFCGAALQDSIMVDWTVKPIFPNLPLLIVAPSGRGKTGAVNAIEPLFKGFLPYKLAEDSTAEAATKDLANARNASTDYKNTCGLWVIPELADVFGTKDYQQGMIARVTRLLDNPKDRRVSRAGESRQIEIPGYCVLTWVAGTTLDWLQKHVDEAVSAGGFLPRLLVHYSGEGTKFVPNPVRDERLISELNADLMRIVPHRALGQEIYNLGEWGWDEIYRGIFEEQKQAEGTLLESFIARRPENMLRVALILSKFAHFASFRVVLAESEMVVKHLEQQALKLAGDLKNSDFAYFADRVLQYLERNGGMTYANLCKNLHVTSKELKFALLDLRERGLVMWDGGVGVTGLIGLPGAE